MKGFTKSTTRARRTPHRHRHDRLRVHGQGALQRLAEDPLLLCGARRLSRSWSRQCAGATKPRSRDMAARRLRPDDGYYTDWRAMLAGPAHQIVDDCTPDDRHCAPSMPRPRAGKHVICEKPLASR